MATQTTNYKLTKPAQNEYYNVDVFNENCDIIDAAIKSATDRAETAIGGIPALQQQIWANGGTFTFQAPKTTTFIAECIGGGGGCTAASGTSGGTFGGGGAYVRQKVTLTAGQNVTVTVGAAGAVSASSPTDGGATSFGSYATAPGGRANISQTGQNNLPGAGDIRLPGCPSYNDMGSTSSYATGFTGSSMYGTPTNFNLGDSAFSGIGQTGAGAGVGAVNLSSTGTRQSATAGMVILTWVG